VVDRDLDFQQAKLFLHALFGREKRPWSAEEEQLLFGITPIHAADVRLIRTWFTLSLYHPVFEKTKRKQELTTFLRDFNGELDKMHHFAPWFDGLAAVSEKKEEPPRWQEFLYWQYDPGVRLPESFWELDETLQEQYFAGFQTFKQECPTG
jgi:hypothetical protein